MSNRSFCVRRSNRFQEDVSAGPFRKSVAWRYYEEGLTSALPQYLPDEPFGITKGLVRR
jgi:hypothetical protein